jgi:hypothetical protein
LAVLLLVSVAVFSARSQTYPIETASAVRFANPYALKDWVPDSVYDATLQHLEYYLAINDVPGKLVTITDGPAYGDDGSLTFEFQTDESSSMNTVTVQTSNYGGGITSSTVTVNGDDTAYAAAPKLYDTGFEGFDGLIDNGLTGAQVYEIQKELMRFSPDGPFDIDTDSIRQTPTPSNTKTIMNIAIGNTRYRLENNTSDINSVDIKLYAADGKQVFDSGRTGLAD